MYALLILVIFLADGAQYRAVTVPALECERIAQEARANAPTGPGIQSKAICIYPGIDA